MKTSVDYSPEPQDKEWFPLKDWLERHNLSLKRTRRHLDTRVVFIGDSITEGWLGEAGRAAWNDAFSAFNPLNLGVGGDEIQHLHWRLVNGEGDGTSPAVVVLLIGTNNLGNAGHLAKEVIERYKRLLDCIQQKWPQAKLLVHTIFPRDAQPDTHFRTEIAKVNDTLRSWAAEDRFTLLDLHDLFLEPDGSISPETMPDFLHLSQGAYTRWASQLKPAIERLLVLC